MRGRLPAYLAGIHPETRRLAADLVHRARFGSINDYRDGIFRNVSEHPRHTTDLVMTLAWWVAANTYPEEADEQRKYEQWATRMHTEYVRIAKQGGKPSYEVQLGEQVYRKTIEAVNGFGRRVAKKKARKGAA